MVKCIKLSFVVIAMVVGGLGSLHAAKPIFLIEPTTPTQINLPENGTASVTYRVTNQTFITRTLVTQAIAGVSQDTSSSGSCSRPFTLAPNASCLLHLSIRGDQMQEQINEGPVVCKTKRFNDDAPDPFLCAQPATAERLQIIRGDTSIPTLTLSPSPLSVPTDSTMNPVKLNVTNNSSFVTATGVKILENTNPPDLQLTQDASGCASLAPQATCQISVSSSLLSSPTPADKTFTVQGDNTQPTSLRIKVVEVNITVTPSTASFLISGSQTITITNNGPGNATNVEVKNIPSPFVQIVSPGCTNLSDAPMSNTCTIEIQAKKQAAQTSLTIEGDNTSIKSTELTPESYAYMSLNNTSIISTQLESNGAASSTPQTGPSFLPNSPGDIKLISSGDRAYVTVLTSTNSSIQRCPVVNGELTTPCSSTGSPASSITNQVPQTTGTPIAIDGTDSHLYYLNTSSQIYRCQIDGTGDLTMCAMLNNPSAFTSLVSLVINPKMIGGNQITYVLNAGSIFRCNDDLLASCTNTGVLVGGLSGAAAVSRDGTTAYFGTTSSQVVSCDINQANGDLENCQSSTTGISSASYLAINGPADTLYFSGVNSDSFPTLTNCSISGGSISSCNPVVFTGEGEGASVGVAVMPSKVAF